MPLLSRHLCQTDGVLPFGPLGGILHPHVGKPGTIDIDGELALGEELSGNASTDCLVQSNIVGGGQAFGVCGLVEGQSVLKALGATDPLVGIGVVQGVLSSVEQHFEALHGGLFATGAACVDVHGDNAGHLFLDGACCGKNLVPVLGLPIGR